MAALPFNLNYSRHFPHLPKPYSTAKQQHQRKTRNHDTKQVHVEHNKDQTCIDDLNDTLLELIFLSFQWRQLATYKCVSKRWNSIISNPDFLRHLPLEQSPFTLYLRGKKRQYSYEKSCGTTGTTCLVTEHPYFQTHKLGLDFLPSDESDDDSYYNRNYIYIVANHNDLLVSYRTLNSEESAYYVANPLTKQFIVVPLTRTQAIDKLPSINNYYNNDYWPPCVVGFAGVVEGVSTTSGNPNSNDGFRIVRIMGPTPGIIQIYSSKTGQWTSYLFNITGFYFRSYMSVVLNDKLYYKGCSKILIIDPFADDIVAPKILNLPGEINSESVLGVSRRRLHIAQFEEHRPYDSKDYPRIKVWEFEDYYNDLVITNCITKMAELRLVIDFPLKPYLFDRILPPIFRIFPRIRRWDRSDRVICCHPYDPHIVFFLYNDTFYRCDVVKHRLKVVTYHVDYDWTERYVFLHPN